MPPSEEFKASTAPLLAARAQPGDLTQADFAAFSLGVIRATRACRRLEPTLPELTSDPKELLAFADLCMFGQQFGPAKDAVQRYLKLPETPDREKAMLVLAKALMGLKDVSGAVATLEAAEREIGYDSQIHATAEQVLSAAALESEQSKEAVLRLCRDQTARSLPLLQSGTMLPGKDGGLAPSVLFKDAIRCVDVARELGDDSVQSALARLRDVLNQPYWRNTADLSVVQAAFERTEMIGRPVPVGAFEAKLVPANGPPLRFPVDLARHRRMLIPFTLWSPSALSTVLDLHRNLLKETIYLVTSWAANTGSDQESAEVLENLRTSVQALPNDVYVLIVPDSVFQQFRATEFPAGILVGKGLVHTNLPLEGEIAKSLLLAEFRRLGS